jgi:hypothetical protein
VLVEGISVIIKRKVIEEKFPGGWEVFVEDVPNKTLCADDEIARVGFMTPADVEGYVNHLSAFGFQYLAEDGVMDLVVVDQLHGFAAKCDWCEIGHANIGNNQSAQVTACRVTGSKITKLVCPEGWKFEESLSQTYDFVPNGELEKSLKFLRHENGLNVYLNQLTGKKVYIGRTGEP